MNEHDIAAALKRIEAPAPGTEARRRARAAALEEFARAQAAKANTLAPAPPSSNNPLQALWRRLRPSRDNNSGSTSMNWFNNRGWLAGAASVCVLALGLTIVWPNLTRDMEDVGHERTAAAYSPPVEVDLQASQDMMPPAFEAPSIEEPMSSMAAEPVVAQEQADTGNAASTTMATPPPQAPHMPAAPPPPMPLEDGSQIIVTGGRAAMKSALEVKRSTAEASMYAQVEQLERVQRIAADSLASAPDHENEEGRDRFEAFEINPVRRVADAPLSTFSADVDTASYSFVRSQLNFGRLPQKDAVRSEEMINYFDYAWPAARSRNAPFKPTVVVSDSPWNKGRKLVHVGIKGYELSDDAPDANLVLLLDVSGSMNEPNKLPLAVRSMEMLLDSLKPSDTVGIVVYAGAAGTVLEPTPVREKSRIVTALRTLRAGGSTAGAQGIERAYELAERHFRKGGVNRILLATDGDFNVGIDSTDELKGFIERKRGKGIYLSVLGFGQGNYRDELAQALAQNGNGVAAYIDTENEARKVLVEEASSSLFTIAKDVKFQVEFNAATVSEYRLVGYETRALRDEDFNNDAIDAGDVGAGHTVTAIYEITPAGVAGSVDEPRYERNRRSPVRDRSAENGGNEYGFVKIRYKLPDEEKSRLISEPIRVRGGDVAPAVARDVSFSTAVAGFAQLLRGGAYTGALTYDDVMNQAQAARGEDRFGYRAEFVELVRKAKTAREM